MAASLSGARRVFRARCSYSENFRSARCPGASAAPAPGYRPRLGERRRHRRALHRPADVRDGDFRRQEPDVDLADGQAALAEADRERRRELAFDFASSFPRPAQHVDHLADVGEERHRRSRRVGSTRPAGASAPHGSPLRRAPQRALRPARAGTNNKELRAKNANERAENAKRWPGAQRRRTLVRRPVFRRFVLSSSFFVHSSLLTQHRSLRRDCRHSKRRPAAAAQPSRYLRPAVSKN